jgi:Kef-type K+ transport system membrane component KefB
MSYVAEKYFGVADITGAYIAGLIISNSQRNKYIASRFDTLSYIFLSPIFFASVGLKVVLPEMTTSIILFALVLTVVAALTKIIGCGIGAKLCKYTNHETVQIGMGMISRGEVALIVASKGSSVGLMSSNFFGPVVVVVVATTIIAPVLLKLSFRKEPDVEEENILAESFDELMVYQKDGTSDN